MSFDHNYIRSKIKNFDHVIIIGQSLMKRNIYCIPIGSGPLSAVFAAAFHGLEYLTAAALLNFAEKYRTMKEYHSKLRVYFIPMVNPDGADIAVNGIDPKNRYHQELISGTGITEFNKRWQANAAGVDINHNFDADWEPVLPGPAPSRYGGKYPGSEPETKTVVYLLDRVRPDLFIAFHSQGKEIYYDFNGMENKRAKRTAERIAESVGYQAAKPTGTACFGGAKDWYIKKYRKAAFTAELGEGVNPLPDKQLPQLTADTEKICLAAISEILKDFNE